MLSKGEESSTRSIRRFSNFDDLRLFKNDGNSPTSSPNFNRSRAVSHNGITSVAFEDSSIRQSKSLRIESSIKSKPNLDSKTLGRLRSSSDEYQFDPIIDVSSYSGSVKKKPSVSFKDLKAMSEKELETEENGEEEKNVKDTAASTVGLNSVSLKKSFTEQIDRIRRVSIKDLLPDSFEEKEFENNKKSGYVSFKDEDGDWRTYNLHRQSSKYQTYDFTCKVNRINL